MPINCKVDGHIMVLEIEGESAYNPMTQDMYLDLHDRFEEFEHRRQYRVAVLTGAGGVHFSVGGHLNPEDGGVLEGLRREFHEEMVADWDPEPRLIGMLKDDDVLVGQVHLGVVFEADAAGRALHVRETHKLNGRFVAPAACEPLYEQMETWSQLLYDHMTGRRSGPVRTG